MTYNFHVILELFFCVLVLYAEESRFITTFSIWECVIRKLTKFWRINGYIAIFHKRKLYTSQVDGFFLFHLPEASGLVAMKIGFK